MLNAQSLPWGRFSATQGVTGWLKPSAIAGTWAVPCGHFQCQRKGWERVRVRAASTCPRLFSGEADDVHERSKGRDFLNETERATLSHLRLDGTCSAIGQPGFKSQPCACWAP